MHRNTCNTSKLNKKVTTGINKTTQNIHNAEPPVLEIMGRASSPISPIASSSTSDTLTQGKRKHVNIFESDSDPDDPFYNSNSSISMPNLTLNTSTIISSPLPFETDNDILLANSSHEKQLQISDNNDSFTSKSSDTFVTVKNKNNQQGTIQRYHDKITNAEIDLVNFKLGKLFFGCNIPFSVVESVHFKEFCQSLRPAYKPPSRTTLSTSVLNKVHNSFCAAIKFHSKSALLIDGWKNEAANTKNVACLLHSSNGEALFLESFDLTGTKETALELCYIVEKCISLALEKHNTNIYAVISDNAANMIKMGKLTTIWHLTCNSHTANLLAKDLVSKPLVDKAKVLLKAFHGPDAEKEMLKQGGRRIQMPCDTRWCTYRDSFKNLLNNVTPMKKVLAISTIRFDESVHQYLFDEIFLKQISDSIELFNPICELINVSQKSTSSIADAAEAWLDLPNKISSDNDGFGSIIKKRQDYALNKYLLTANFLHPKYQGKKMKPEHKDIIEDFILNSAEIGSEGLNSFIEYKEKNGLFKILFEKQTLSTTAFWSFAKNKHPELQELANKLLNLPASTAQLERVFSNWSYIHNSLRNRLNPERSRKLLSTYYSLKLNEKTQSSSNEY